MTSPDRRIGVHLTPRATWLAGVVDGRWTFRELAPDRPLAPALADWLGLALDQRPLGRCDLHLVFEDVAPDLSAWPAPWQRFTRVANEDFRGVVGIRVLERLGRPLPQVRMAPADLWRTVCGLQPDLYDPAPQPDPEDLTDDQPVPPAFWMPGQAGPTARHGQAVLVPACGRYAGAVAAVLLPWVLLLDEGLEPPVAFTADDRRQAPPPVRFRLAPGQLPPTDERLARLRAAWSRLFDLATDCLYMDGFDTDDSVATRLLISTVREPTFALPVERVSSLAAVLDELDPFMEDLEGELVVTHAGLRVQTVELDKPKPPSAADLGWGAPAVQAGWEVTEGPLGQWLAHESGPA